MRTIAHLYDSYQVASEVARALEAAGFQHDHVSVLANQGSLPETTTQGIPSPLGAESATAAGTGTGTGASIGTLLGGGAGLLAGIGALAIPGVGPVVAAGWLVATLTGAGAGAGLGGLVGALTGSGVHSDQAHVYAEGVRRGGTLVTVRADDDLTAKAESIMLQHNPVDVTNRAASYRDDGWTGFDETRSGLSPQELEAERRRALPPIG